MHTMRPSNLNRTSALTLSTLESLTTLTEMTLSLRVLAIDSDGKLVSSLGVFMAHLRSWHVGLNDSVLSKDTVILILLKRYKCL